MEAVWSRSPRHGNKKSALVPSLFVCSVLLRVSEYCLVVTNEILGGPLTDTVMKMRNTWHHEIYVLFITMEALHMFRLKRWSDSVAQKHASA